MTRCSFPWSCLLACAVSGWSASAPAQADPSRAAEESALRQAGRDYLAALEQGDLKALSGFWTAEGTYTDASGQTTKVRELLAQPPAATRAARPALSVSNVTVRFLTADVAIEEGDCTLWVRQEGRWRLEYVRESAAAPPPNPQPLAPLDPLVGDWTGEVNQLTVKVEARWNPTRTFLRRDLSILSADKPVFHGIQHVGWDPLQEQINSWMFNDDGSFGQGVWRQEGHAWMITAARVLPDGQQTSSTQIIRFKDRNTLVWRSIRGDHQGQDVPDFEVVLRRAAPAPASKPSP
jgi:hypothetical protein